MLPAFQTFGLGRSCDYCGTLIWTLTKDSDLESSADSVTLIRTREQVTDPRNIKLCQQYLLCMLVRIDGAEAVLYTNLLFYLEVLIFMMLNLIAGPMSTNTK